MAKVVVFDGKKIGVDKEYHLLDSQRNMKKMSKHYTDMLEGFNKIEESNKDEDGELSMKDYTKERELVAQTAIDTAADLLQLTKEQKDKLLDYSVSDLHDLYSECLYKFLDIELPKTDDEDEDEDDLDEDPKLQDEEQSGN
ncbi:hypothetical protein GNF18_10165 [Ligilactobacillus pobuzihii]|uniref:hypothetical protein n=1 Tax=Ligilactobacillus pobuzihii TaxID=449659 RepID=UPI0019CFBD77|nr:hypothetical protein [Ligilactobacillus pobuzihii]MBN7275504.1 hypothetical protein [Ligilactobacillus pobuzihii]